MDTEIREWFNEIWTYCEEHWTAVLVSAAVVLLLLLSAVLISAARREDRKTLQEQEPAETGAEEILPEEEPEAEPEPEVPEPSETADIIQESAMGMVDSLVKSMENAAGAAGQKVESIELKIEKAQLTIRYAGNEGKTVSEELFEDKADKNDENPAETAGAAEEVQSEKTDFAENIGHPKRFGLDNMNTARSGRVYTEEELLNQIRD